MHALEVFTSNTRPCDICNVVKDLDDDTRKDYSKLCQEALIIPICAYSTVYLATKVLQILKLNNTDIVSPIHVIYHFQINVCFESCALPSWPQKAKILQLLGDVFKLTAQDAEWCRVHWDDADSSCPVRPKHVLKCIKDFKKNCAHKCDCSKETKIDKMHVCSDYPLIKQINLLDPSYRFLSACGDPRRAHKSDTVSECSICNMYLVNKTKLDLYEIKFNGLKDTVGKPVNALLDHDQLFKHITFDQKCKHYLTDPVCAYNRLTTFSPETGYKPCIKSLTAAFLYKLIQKFYADLRDANDLAALLDYLVEHHMLTMSYIEEIIW